MSLQRLWQRQLAGASGVALFVPVSMLVMLAVLGLTGGFAGLGTLGQLISGPAAPSPLAGVVRTSARRAVRPAPGGRAIAAPAALRAARPIPAADTAASAAPPPTVKPPSGSRRPAGAGSPAPSPPPSRPAPHPGARRPAPPPGSGTPGPGVPPTPVDALVAAGAGLASQLPSPAGATVGQVLRSVGSTADGLLKPGR